MAKQENTEIESIVPGAMETRTRIYLDGPDSELPLVDKTDRTNVGIGGMTESVDISLRRATGCQHVLHTGAEIGAVCANQDC